jgi:hypothetical protein
MATVVEEKERGEGSSRAASGSSSSPRVQPIHDKEKYFPGSPRLQRGRDNADLFTPSLGRFV